MGNTSGASVRRAGGRSMRSTHSSAWDGMVQAKVDDIMEKLTVAAETGAPHKQCQAGGCATPAHARPPARPPGRSRKCADRSPTAQLCPPSHCRLHALMSTLTRLQPEPALGGAGKGNLLELAIEAARRRCSVGEISYALERVRAHAPWARSGSCAGGARLSCMARQVWGRHQAADGMVAGARRCARKGSRGACGLWPPPLREPQRPLLRCPSRHRRIAR